MPDHLEIQNEILRINAVADATRGWFIGQFVPQTERLRHQKDVELKWGIHPAGERRSAWAYYNRATTIAIVLEGRFQIYLRKDGVIEDHVLEKPGDYVIMPPRLNHSWRAITDAVVLTVRFPSTPDDQVEVFEPAPDSIRP